MKKLYNWINISVLSMTLIVFCNLCTGIDGKAYGFSGASVAILLTMAVSVYGIKAFRLYFILFDQKILPNSFLKQYCKTIPVSIIMPFKLGDIFKIYCYGYEFANYFNGAIVVLLDRFVDTLALVSVLSVLSIMYGTGFSTLLDVLLVFIIGILICYVLFPGMYRYWKNYFLKANATENGIRILGLFERLNESYKEIRNIAKGRCAILYIVSLIAWVIELSGVAVLNYISGRNGTSSAVIDYLASALYGSGSVYLAQFILISVIVMISLYILLHFMARSSKGENNAG